MVYIILNLLKFLHDMAFVGNKSCFIKNISSTRLSKIDNSFLMWKCRIYKEFERRILTSIVIFLIFIRFLSCVLTKNKYYYWYKESILFMQIFDIIKLTYSITLIMRVLFLYWFTSNIDYLNLEVKKYAMSDVNLLKE